MTASPTIHRVTSVTLSNAAATGESETYHTLTGGDWRRVVDAMPPQTGERHGVLRGMTIAEVTA